MPPAPTYSFNPFKGLSSEGAKWRFPVEKEEEVHAFHRALPGYQSTPLVSLPRLAANLEVGNVLVKDESQRLGLNAFKVLGARYAVYRILQRRWQEKFGSPLSFAQFLDTTQARRLGELTFRAAADGNHGRGVVWISRHLTMRCVVFVPAYTTKDRIVNIENEQAHVIVVEGDYAATLVAAGQATRENGWTEVGDCVYEGYARLGNSRADAVFELYNNDNGELLAKGGLTQVFVDPKSRKSMPIPPFFKAGILMQQPELNGN